LDPLIKIPDCPVLNLVATSYEMQSDPQGGFGVIIWTFMGGIDLGSGGEGGGGEQFAQPNEVIEMSIGVDQVPLGMHPKISTILKSFGGTVKEGELTFPVEDPSGTSKRKGVNADGDEFPLNPLYGVTSFFAPRATFRIRRLNRDGDIGALGKLDLPPLPNLPTSGLARRAGNWIKTGVNRRDHGSTTETTEEWLYATAGWEPKIYEYA
jgi:hypothetical protein